ncbi:hypothetical protein PoB_005913600 [Plakobranchus ocellatus]|uniref:Uncharacterized protein n=1 Tax=Plakobranchus ocellatus TaxID=259542 RepID=A0AAV4CID3_9GAST|nr:hypothetical protein PoB_005913600 [Plakobranchus ocellatus]
MSALVEFDQDKLTEARSKQLLTANSAVYNHRDRGSTSQKLQELEEFIQSWSTVCNTEENSEPVVPLNVNSPPVSYPVATEDLQHTAPCDGEMGTIGDLLCIVDLQANSGEFPFSPQSRVALAPPAASSSFSVSVGPPLLSNVISSRAVSMDPSVPSNVASFSCLVSVAPSSSVACLLME